VGTISREATVTTELRLVVRATIDFPRVLTPVLRDEKIAKEMGLWLTPEDLYNLVPWSWLVDWFSGIGDYVKAYDNVNIDPELVETGFITGESLYQLRSTQVTEAVSSRSFLNTPPVPGILHKEEFRNRINREARLECTTQIRRSVISAYGVKPAWELTGLSDFQVSILGALLYIQKPETRALG